MTEADLSVPVIEARSASKRYGSPTDGTLALEDVSLKVDAKEFVCIVGPSGCGKSTLLKLITGMEKTTSGQILRFGKEVTGPTPDIGMVFQQPVLMKWRRVLDNVLFPIDALGRNRADYIDKARALLKMANLSEFEQSWPRELSGGMQQRVALCRALIHDPPCLLMDEPFGALDALTRDKMNIELLRIWRETQKATLLITHSVAEAVFLADRVLVMKPRPGRVQEEIRIELDRPRVTQMRSSARFNDYVQHINGLLGVHD